MSEAVKLLTYQRGPNNNPIAVGDYIYLHERVKRLWPWNRGPRVQPVRIESMKDWNDGKGPVVGVRWGDGKYECYYASDTYYG